MIEGAGLVWGVKESLIDYVLDQISDGAVTLRNGATEVAPRRYRFPAAEPSDQPCDLYRFQGSLELSGYYGALNVSIAEPWVELGDDAATVTMLDPDESGARVVIARAARPTSTKQGFTLRPVLAESAVELFLMRYSAGQDLSPLSVHM